MGICSHCGKPLNESQIRGNYKSCPHCSPNNGEHIYYEFSSFGTSEARETSTNPDGIQSWCSSCRFGGIGSGGKKCSEI